MVEFHCAQCGSTLKKKQVEAHLSRGCFQVMCSDCGDLFEGMAYKQHCKCKSEAEKYYGSYLKKTEQKKKQKKWTSWKESVKKFITSGDDVETVRRKACEEFMNQCRAEEVKKFEKEVAELKEKEEEWKGWRTTLKEIIQSEKEGIKERKLIKAAVARFNLSFKSAGISDEEIKKTVLRKLKNRRYIQEGGCVRLRK